MFTGKSGSYRKNYDVSSLLPAPIEQAFIYFSKINNIAEIDVKVLLLLYHFFLSFFDKEIPLHQEMIFSFPFVGP